MYLESSPTTNKMGRLIPLFLKATTSYTQSSQLSCRWDPVPRAESPTLPPASKSTSRTRRRPSPVTNITIVPYTAAEWLKAMEEVKTLYYKQQYRQCAARCKQILETIRDPYRVHPLYSIYLCFFAAFSLELTARSLHNNSSLKLPLLQESVTYYRKAQSYMEFATFAANPEIIHASNLTRHSSMSSSIRSSTDSVFSDTSDSSVDSSILDSPTDTEFPEIKRQSSTEFPALKRQSSTSSILKPAPLRRIKKRVSFLLNSEPSTPSAQDLGITADDLLARFPSPPSHDALSPTIIPQNYSAPSSPPSCPLPEPPSRAERTALALQRYKNHLLSLNSQLEYHANSSLAQIHTLTTVRRARRSNGPDLFANTPQPYTRLRSGSQSSCSSSSSSSSFISYTPSSQASTIFTPSQTLGLGLTPETPSTLQSSPLSITTRIARLKERGWLRPRFNAEKYRDLCERAMAELNEEGFRGCVR